MSRDDYGPGSLTAFLTGAIIGAATALLLTPKTGRETRGLLVDYGSTLKDNLPEDFKGAAVSQGKNLIEQGKKLIDRGNAILNEGHEIVDDKKMALNAAIEAGKEAMQKEKEALAAELDDDA